MRKPARKGGFFSLKQQNMTAKKVTSTRCIICNKIVGGRGPIHKYDLCYSHYKTIFNIKALKTTEAFMKAVIKLIIEVKTKS